MQDEGQLGKKRSDGNGSQRDELIIREESASLNLTKEVVELMVIRAVDTLVIPKFEGLIRRVVHQEVNSAIQDKILATIMGNSANEICAPLFRSLQLKFLGGISDLVLTGRKIKGENRDFIKLALVDDRNGEVVSSGPEASLEIELVVLREDFGEHDDWTPDYFKNKIVAKGSLSGSISLTLNAGTTLLDNIKFKHASRWTKKSKLRLGARAVDNFYGFRIKEAKTKPFDLMDRRSEHPKKRYPLSLSDDVCKLVHIRKGHSIYKRLLSTNIKTVKDFLTWLSVNQEGLENILGNGDDWEETFNQARTCSLDENVHLYFGSISQQDYGVVFNCVGQLLGHISQWQYVPVVDITDSIKAGLQKLLQSAFEWNDDAVKLSDSVHPFASVASLQQYISQRLVNCNMLDTPRLESRRNLIEPSTSSLDVMDNFDSQILSVPHFHVTAAYEDNFHGLGGTCSFQHEYTVEDLFSDQIFTDFSHACMENGSQFNAQKKWRWLLISVRWYVRRKRLAAVGDVQLLKKQRV